MSPPPATVATVTTLDLPTPVLGSLSPSRAGDFMSCPLRYRFRVIDRLPEAPSPAATRGTLVHAVLERLFDLPAPRRTLTEAQALLPGAWAALQAEEPELAALFDTTEAQQDWLRSADALLEGYFTLEDPRRLDPASREDHVEVVLGSGLRLHGIIDRLDRAPGGALRVVDYKTGRAPGEAFEAAALFQMRFYALVLWRAGGVLPRLLQLLYLGDRQVLSYAPTEQDLLATERKVAALWTAIEQATRTGDFRPRRSRLCDWCDHQALCPEFGGTPPPLPPPPVPVGASASAAVAAAVPAAATGPV
jgi:putative RecB family exonuclease